MFPGTPLGNPEVAQALTSGLVDACSPSFDSCIFG